VHWTDSQGDAAKKIFANFKLFNFGDRPLKPWLPLTAGVMRSDDSQKRLIL